MQQLTLEATVSCARLVVFESLPTDEAKTGTSLVDKLSLHDAKFPVELTTVGSTRELEEAMLLLSSQLELGVGAALHLEMHGDAMSGLVLSPSSDRDFGPIRNGCKLAQCRGVFAMFTRSGRVSTSTSHGVTDDPGPISRFHCLFQR